MEVIIGLVLVCLALVCIYCVVVYVIIPIAGILGVIALTIGVSYAFFVSLKSFITSLILHINPYTTYIDKNLKASSGVQRSYFFGPGYHQIAITVKDTFYNLKSYIDSIGAWWKAFRIGHKWILNMWVGIFYISACACAYVFGTAWAALFSLLLFTVIFVGMCGFYVFFSLLWLGDRITLMIRSIHSRCPNCKRVSIVPAFSCPDCGTQHQNLTPGPYGVLTRKCTCGRKLPTTIFNGRSKLEALCPYCQSTLAISDARQFGIQLVGGPNTGKTSFLAAYWHCYVDKLKSDGKLDFTCFPEEAFDELEYWYRNGITFATSEINAIMYSIVHKRNKCTPIQMTVYDIAGESYSTLEDALEFRQQQFKYCEGAVIVVDPTATLELNVSAVSSFVSVFREMRGIHSSKRLRIPVAVIVSKADLYKKELGIPKIKSIYNHFAANDETSDLTFSSVRDNVCRKFLCSHGFEELIFRIDCEFTNVQYFPVSAIGHKAEESVAYEPWGVVEPISWIIQQTNVQL